MFKVKVYVWPKATILDPQGNAILRLVERIEDKSIKDIRQGKCFLLTFNEAKSIEFLNRLATEILSNPVIEDFEIEIIT